MRDPDEMNMTKAMERALREEKTPTELIARLPDITLRGYLLQLMGKRAISTDALAQLAALNRSSLYKILNGTTKHPQRNILIRLALVLSLSFDETQELLRRGGRATLSGNRARDTVISHGIIKHRSIEDVNEHLRAHYFDSLYEKD